MYVVMHWGVYPDTKYVGARVFGGEQRHHMTRGGGQRSPLVPSTQLQLH